MTEKTTIKRDYIGSADAYDIFKENYQGLIKSKLNDTGYVSPRMARGIAMERDIIEQYASESGIAEVLWKVKTSELPNQPEDIPEYCHSEIDALATFRGEDEIWEVKTSEKAAPLDEQELLHSFPRYYYQVQYQMWTGGCYKAKVLWCNVPDIEDDQASPYDEEGMLDISVIEIKYNAYATTAFLINCPKFWEEWTKAKSNDTQLVDYVDIQEFVQLQKAIEEKTTELAMMTKGLEERASEIRSNILKAMEENGIVKYENDDIAISYVAPFKRPGVDTKKMKEDGIYEEYVKYSNVKASIRIKMKEAKDGTDSTTEVS